MIAIAFNKFPTNAGKTISKWKRNRGEKNRSHSGFDYARSFNVELVSSSNKRRYSSSRRLKK